MTINIVRTPPHQRGFWIDRYADGDTIVSFWAFSIFIERRRL